ncbi:MAG: hypothetical protein AAGF01_21270 [Cyanobacteria bacterium P01_G01_bin.38]
MTTTFLKSSQPIISKVELLSNSGSSLIEQDRQKLENAFRSSNHFETAIQARLLKDWENTWEPFLAQKTDRSISLKTQTTSELAKRLNVFREQHSSLLNQDFLGQIDFLSNALLTVQAILDGLSLIIEKPKRQGKQIKVVELLCNGYKMIADNFIPFSDWLVRQESDREVLKSFSELANLNAFNEWFGTLKFRSKDERELASRYKASILRSMKSILWDLDATLGQAVVPCVLDSEVFYLDADSAEGKALKRSNHLDSEDHADWIVVEPDSDISIKILRERIEARGYKVSTENTSSSDQ